MRGKGYKQILQSNESVAEFEVPEIGVNKVKFSSPSLTVISLCTNFDTVILKLLQSILRRNVPALDLNIDILFPAMDPTRPGQPWQHGILDALTTVASASSPISYLATHLERRPKCAKMSFFSI